MDVGTQRRQGPAERTLWSGLLDPSAPPHARTEVMAVVRDEMRAPLLGLEALADALAGTPLNRDVSARMRDHSRVLARRVSLLIEDLALVAMQDAASLSLDVRQLDLDELLADAVASFPEMLIRVEGDKGLRVHADPLRVQQVLANLMRNIQRRGDRAVTVRVTARGPFVSLRSADGGPHDSYELALVKALVHAHGGMTVHEVGGSFTFTLPRAGTMTSLPISAT